MNQKISKHAWYGKRGKLTGEASFTPNRNKTLQMMVHPSVAERLTQYDAKIIEKIERDTRNKVVIVKDPNCHQEEMKWDVS